jgi:hypothetical protein
MLLHLENEDLENELGIKSNMVRNKFLALVKKMKADEIKADGQKSGRDYNGMPLRTFTQYRAMNRREADFMIGLAVGAPRVLLSKAFARGMGPQEDESWFSWLFTPHLYVARHSTEIMYGLPSTITAMCYLMFIANLIRMALVLKVMTTTALPQDMKNSILIGVAIGIFGAELFVWLFVNVWWLVYPIIPWFLW